MRLTFCVALLFVAMAGCSSSDEVQRSTSPDGQVDAIVTESDCGAPYSFVYEISLVPTGKRSDQRVAILDASTRNAHAWGVNVKWLYSMTLSAEYLKADSAKLERQTVVVAGHQIKILLLSGVTDPKAPAGGMLFNR